VRTILRRYPRVKNNRGKIIRRPLLQYSLIYAILVIWIFIEAVRVRNDTTISVAKVLWILEFLHAN